MRSLLSSGMFVFSLTFFMSCLTAFSYSGADPQESKMRSIHTFKEKSRVALVIGNEAYNSSPLLNPVNDAMAMGRTLRSLGFDVTIMKDLTWRKMSAAIDQFGKRLCSGTVGLFYYAGHGIQLEGKNYLIPVDADIHHEKEVKYKGIDADFVLAEMENSGEQMNILILDACRGNPFYRSFRSASEGLSFMDAPLGTIIAYATGPGKNASDGDGVNGIYTSELIKHLQMPGLRLVDIFNQVRRAVRIRTKGHQIPWESTSLESAFYFIPPNTQVDISPKIHKPDSGISVPVINSAISHEISEKNSTRKKQWTESITQMQFVWIAGDCYQMGCGHWDNDCEEDESPVHTACVGDFWIGKYEVTNKQFIIFLNDIGHKGPEGEFWVKTKDQDQVSHISIGMNGFEVETGYESHPVIAVSWYGAKAFTQWLSEKTGFDFNLPTEAEWEYASRSGGGLEKFSGGENAEQYAWFVENSSDTTHPVGRKASNGLGIHDMSGNVWEWCRDIYFKDAYLKHVRDNPVELVFNDFVDSPGRVIRGGSYRYEKEYCRSSNRGGHRIAGQTNDLGFRVVKAVSLRNQNMLADQK